MKKKKYKIPNVDISVMRVLDTIDSCKTKEHLEGASRMVELFKKMFSEHTSDINECDDFLYVRKHEFKNGLKPSFTGLKLP